MIALHKINKSYSVGEISVKVLKSVSLYVISGEFVAIMGPSGSGKTTLLNLIGCLDTIDQGNYVLAKQAVQQASEDELAQVRNRHIGFVFQSFNLIPKISALRNVELPMIYAGVDPQERVQRALHALQRVGLEDRAQHLPAQLSGGQQQRVAIARALINAPEVLVADEPTGSLDSQTGHEIMNLFKEVNQSGTTIVMVTHEAHIAAYAQRVVRMQDGVIVNDSQPIHHQI